MKEAHKELITDILAASGKANVDLSDTESFEGFLKFLQSCGFEKITFEGYDAPPYYGMSIFYYLLDVEKEETSNNVSNEKEINNER